MNFKFQFTSNGDHNIYVIPSFKTNIGSNNLIKMLQFFILASLSALLMIFYEFGIGVFTKFILRREVAWNYTKFKNNKFRSISAFTIPYFFAWFVLGMIHVYLFENVFSI